MKGYPITALKKDGVIVDSGSYSYDVSAKMLTLSEDFVVEAEGGSVTFSIEKLQLGVNRAALKTTLHLYPQEKQRQKYCRRELMCGLSVVILTP